ncbi:polysaccharide deacetylase family protein [Crocinitomicaceae bacterium CZZ-1]|uniref:Polysaccharide deacetylase family protein n=1 Tax=Taishania pollutisoli TaxID=2766479 RepID=A0A8J6U1Q0_9FLAO|nr:polysaccharide deacetylase family protein [Taishania pollutisoli]MBC9811410.1 polysaccharide deacetylase family protein [Taishania pollutisoli]MBX2947670.1 polysaccharide deacetylase family protein [Crocinitomicaceae bacterium]NGF75195.1 polysaccharide deacetylase family protein [Fluviicola sp. SGL-29]
MHRSPKLLHKLFPARIWGISVSDKSVFLTFDDGPHPEITSWVLDFLKEKNIRATFFCVGENVERFPDLYRRLLDEGHRTGNHTMKHLNGMKTDKKTYLHSILETEKQVKSNLFRPPYGRLNRKMDKLLTQRFKIIMWTWLSKDYDASIPVDSIIKAAESIQPGDILVFHDNLKSKERLQKLLPPIVERLLAENYLFRVID